jgi:hypothetical protein
MESNGETRYALIRDLRDALIEANADLEDLKAVNADFQAVIDALLSLIPRRARPSLRYGDTMTLDSQPDTRTHVKGEECCTDDDPPYCCDSIEVPDTNLHDILTCRIPTDSAEIETLVVALRHEIIKMQNARHVAPAIPVIPDAVRAVLEDNVAEYPNAEIEAFLASSPTVTRERIAKALRSTAPEIPENELDWDLLNQCADAILALLRGGAQ